MHQSIGTEQMHSPQNPSIMDILRLRVHQEWGDMMCISVYSGFIFYFSKLLFSKTQYLICWVKSCNISVYHNFPTLYIWLFEIFDVFFSVGWPDLSCHSCGPIIDYCSQDCLIKQAAAVLFFKSNSNKPSSCALFSFDPPTDLIFSCGVCVERATHPLHNNDGFCLHLPVFLLSASPAELQLFQCQPWHQRGALPHWHGEDDQV